jgi:uncharacterized membrane protein YphA (DoxX/SURF4 family)
MKKAIAVEIISVLFIFLFIYAATSKLMDLEKFRIQVGQSSIITKFTNLIIWLIPALELMISIFLIIPKYRLLALYSSFCLMSLFTAYIVFVLNFSDFIPCSCGGILEHMSWKTHVYFNLTFMAMAIGGIFIEAQIRYKTNFNKSSLLQ